MDFESKIWTSHVLAIPKRKINFKWNAGNILNLDT